MDYGVKLVEYQNKIYQVWSKSVKLDCRVSSLDCGVLITSVNYHSLGKGLPDEATNKIWKTWPF